MRYFRFQGESKLAAVLYGLLEEANFPQSKRLRKRLNELKYASGPEDKRLLEFMLDPLVPQQTLLSVWNYEYQFYIHLKRLFTEQVAQQSVSDEELLAILQGELQFELVNYWELPGHHSNFPTVIWSATEDCTVLLYRYYAVESIAITPCGHLYPKWSLFASARHTMGGPMSQVEFERTAFPCHCGKDISTAVYLKGKEAARPLDKAAATDIYISLLAEEQTLAFDKYYRNMPSDLCCNCSELKGRIICRKRHRLCIACLGGLAITRLQFRCIFCQDKVSGYSWDEICRQIQTVTFNPDTEVAAMCEVCRIYVNFSEFEESWNSPHGCLICNTCMRSSKRACPSCDEIASIIQPIKSADIAKKGQIVCDNCYCDKQIAAFGAVLITRHYCLVCDYCITKKWIGGNFDCPKCHEVEVFTDQSNTERVESSMRILCRKCGVRNDISGFSQAALLTHWPKCRICDTCLSEQLQIHFSPNCLVCSQQYEETDLKYLSTKRQALKGSKREQTADRGPQRCNKCGFFQEASHFTIYYDSDHPCRACDECYWKYSGRTQLQCPLCQAFGLEKSGKLHQVVDSFTKISNKSDQLHCTKCKKLKSLHFLTKYSELTHSCIICNDCIERPIIPQICPVCEVPYLRADLAKLGRVALQKKCQCGKTIMEDANAHCNLRCLCSICNVKDFLLTRKAQCSKCSGAVTGYRINSLACSGCFRNLSEYPSDITHAVCGICPNEHVFCCYCTGVDNCLTACRLCGSGLDVRAPAEVVAAQQKFPFACFCGRSSKSEEMTRLSCGHEAHSSCFPNIYYCRQCPRTIKTLPPRKTLRDFLQ